MDTSQSRVTTTGGGTLIFSKANKTGFVLAILLALVGTASVLFPTPEGEVGPPLAILVLSAVLGVITLIAVAIGWRRQNRTAIRAAAAARVVDVLLVIPAFSTPDVPQELQIFGAIFILVSIVTLVLMLRPAPRSQD